jgi:16S rRNA (guanine1207-N2)-methyltransferase
MRFVPPIEYQNLMALSHANDPRAAALDSYFSRHPEVLAGENAAIVFRAVPGAYLDRLQGRPVQCLQSDKPAADALARLGLTVSAEPEPPAGLAIVFATKHKEETLYHFARAVSVLDEGGTLIVSAANDLGAPSLERRCAELLGGVETYSKHKCRVFRGRKEAARLNHGLLEAWLRLGEWQPIAGTDLVSRPGVFSWKSVDSGSRLLAQHLPDDLAGRGADLGAGYGYLSRELLARPHRIAELHLFEAERKALDAAERNLAGHTGNTAVHYHWADVTAGLPVDGLDFVVMNPPFHIGREAVSALGRAFVRAALGALRPDGRLFLVANRHLPYEGEIQAMSGRVESKIEGGGFKVIVARKEKS